MKPTNGIPKEGVRVLAAYWHGFAVAESGDRLILLSRGEPVYEITCNTESQRCRALRRLCAFAEGGIAPVTWIDPEIQSFHPALALGR